MPPKKPWYRSHFVFDIVIAIALISILPFAFSWGSSEVAITSPSEGASVTPSGWANFAYTYGTATACYYSWAPTGLWTNATPDSAPAWKEIAMSGDGNIIYAIADGTAPLRKSSDGGGTWSNIDSLAGDSGTQAWASVSMSSNGSVIAAAVDGGNVYYSYDSGSSWLKSSGTGSWVSVSVSSGGHQILASASDGSLFRYRNMGETSYSYNPMIGSCSDASCSTQSACVAPQNGCGGTWDETTYCAQYGCGGTYDAVSYTCDNRAYTGENPADLCNPSNNPPQDICEMAPSGCYTTQVTGCTGIQYPGNTACETEAAACEAEPGGCNATWTALGSRSVAAPTNDTYAVGGDGSFNFEMGGQWSEPLGGMSLSEIKTTSDGQTIAGIGGTMVYVSTNMGGSFSSEDLGVSLSSVAVASGNSNVMAVTAASGSIFMSFDQGATWTEYSVGSAKPWTSIALSSDGDKAIAVASDGSMYSYEDEWTQFTSCGATDAIAPQVGSNTLYLRVLGNGESRTSVSFTYPSSEGGGGQDNGGTGTSVVPPGTGITQPTASTTATSTATSTISATSTVATSTKKEPANVMGDEQKKAEEQRKALESKLITEAKNRLPEREVFLRSLAYGYTGRDVKMLQMFLNANGFLLATSSWGSPGEETEFFGSLTRAALGKFQASYLPSVTEAGKGIFGVMTRSFVNKNWGILKK